MPSSSPQPISSPPREQHSASSASKRSKSIEYQQSDANIQNFAPVARIMKAALPENAKIAKEAKECMQECVSEFISFITSEASEKCQQEKRKTVNGEDILFAMTSLGFENYGEALKIYLARYRENLVARGEHQRPGQPGSAGEEGAAFDTSNPAVLGNPIDPSSEGAAEFAGYSVSHQPEY